MGDEKVGVYCAKVLEFRRLPTGPVWKAGCEREPGHKGSCIAVIEGRRYLF